MIDFIFGGLFLWFAHSQYKYYKRPAEASRANIRMMALIIMIYGGVYGGYRLWLGFGGTPFGGF